MLTLEKARQSVLAAVENAPEDKCNPFDVVEGVCLYDDGEGNHCIVGQVLVDNGLSIPSSNQGIYWVYLENRVNEALVTQDAITFLSDVQSVFDGPERPTTWRLSLNEAKKQGLFDKVYDD